MNATLVWILLVVSTGHPLNRTAYPTQADCLRAGSTLNQYGKYHTPTLCVSERVVNPYGYSPMSVEPSADVIHRAQGNYHDEQRHLQAILAGESTH